MAVVYGTRPIKRTRRTKSEISEIANGLLEVLSEYNPMTVRQVFYQMVSRGYVPKTEQAYKNLVCRLLTRLRLEGTIPFGWIADNTRWMRKPTTYDGMREALEVARKMYRRALWTRQNVYVEVWIEKDALAGVIYDITARWDIPLMVTRGYPSLSYAHEAAQYMVSIGKPVYIYYLGDYDPSGLDIVRALRTRLFEFTNGLPIHFRHIAVTPEQISEWDLPTRPTKTTDPRAIHFNGNQSVELDAIPVHLLRGLVDNAILQHVDLNEVARLRQIEEAEKQSLALVIDALSGNGSEGE